ncbi:hypothetical protein N0V93_001138 [Gnomoniopsis smithogilvyi]|uniref:Chitin synthesis regulation, Congo red resistance, RCR protein n=1 Tax=Gnomoniopsis smithogilvyi TaxID=1191159 RepID=A0A9W8Z2Y7_9PEZI|nr:hypothetical protein N0V93_001138 [Gnomoniopsis smithogilvyi]
MMIPQSHSLGELAARQTFRCPSGTYLNSYGNCVSSGWANYGRWVLAAIVIVFFIALFVIWSCISNRRRRRRGLQPMYGTGWVPGHAYNNQGQQPQYNQGGWFGGFGHKNHNQPPPPQYTPAPPQGQQYTGQTFDSNDGYYGHHQNDVPLQQPSGTYYPRGGEPVYEPPAGPPPPKN